MDEGLGLSAAPCYKLSSRLHSPCCPPSSQCPSISIPAIPSRDVLTEGKKGTVGTSERFPSIEHFKRNGHALWGITSAGGNGLEPFNYVGIPLLSAFPPPKSQIYRWPSFQQTDPSRWIGLEQQPICMHWALCPLFARAPIVYNEPARRWQARSPPRVGTL